MQRETRQQISRSAGAAVECAFVMPLLVTLLLGMFEVSRALLVKEALSNAAQQACRVASSAGKSTSSAQTEVDAVMAANGITGYSMTLKVNDVVADANTAKRFDKVSVQVSVPVSKVFWVSTFFVKASMVESEVVTMMRQS